MTAYGGWKAFAKAKPGDTIFVTTAAGPVGSSVLLGVLNAFVL